MNAARRRIATHLLAVFVGALLVGWWWLPSIQTTEPFSARFVVYPPEETSAETLHTPVLSRDGKLLLSFAQPDYDILLRRLDEFESEVFPVSGVTGTFFFSPDSRWIGFYSADGYLKKVSVAGGDPITICPVSIDSPGAAWGWNDRILFSPYFASGLWEVSSEGGQPSEVTVPDRRKGERGHLWPEFLPDRRHVSSSCRRVSSCFA